MRNFYILSLIFLHHLQLNAQDFTSKDDHIGKWKSAGTWKEGAIPGNTGEAGDSIKIYGTVTLEDLLILDNGNQLVVYDTLWVRGNLTIYNETSLTVSESGVLIVDGIFYIEEGSFVNSGLTVLINYYEMYGGEFVNKGPSNELYAFNKRNNYQDGGFYDSDRIGTETEFEFNHNTLYNQIANGTLPIHLLSFTATPQSNSVLLDWITAWEENFDFFTIERAGNDLQFKAIGTIKGSGNTVAEVAYSFTDKSPLNGQSFYRLKATDFDGSVEHHKIISVHFNGVNARISTTTVYPNPVSNHSLKVETSESSVSEVRLLDLSGHIIYTQSAQMGINEISLPETIKPGAYVLVLLGGQGKQPSRMHQQKIMVL